MLRFFRNIRQHGLAENKSSKYLLYGVGEIILVVIGILIALWIDTRYTEHQLQKTEQKYLSEMRDNLVFDLKDIQFNIDYNEIRLRSNQIVLQYLNKEIPYSDTLEVHFSNLFLSTRTLPNNSTYETIKSRGLDIISNDSLRQQITTLYDFWFKNLIDFETKDDHNMQYHMLLPEIMKAIEINKVEVSAKPVNEQAILTNYQFKNSLTINIHIRKYMLESYYNVQHQVQQAIIQIDQFLDSK